MKKMSCIFLVLCFSIQCIFAAVPVFAAFEAQQSFVAAADTTYVNGSFNGTGDTLETQQMSASQAAARTAFLKFDLSSIKANIAAGGTISKATVKLYVSKQYYSSPARMSLFAYDDDTWDEGSNPPAVRGVEELVAISKDLADKANDYVTVNNGLSAGSPVELDITNALIQETAKPDDNYISMEVGYRTLWLGSGTTIFYSREYSNASYHPTLSVEYSNPVKEEIQLNDAGIYSGTALAPMSEIFIAQGTAAYSKPLSGDIKTAVIEDLENGDTTVSFKVDVKSLSDPSKTLMIRGHSYQAHAPILKVTYSDDTTANIIANASAKAYLGNADTVLGSGNPFNLYSTTIEDTQETVAAGAAFMKFDVSSLASKINDIKTIQLIVQPQNNPVPCDFTLNVYKVPDDTWKDTSLTWNNMPRFSSMTPVMVPVAGANLLNYTLSSTYQETETVTAIWAVYVVNRDNGIYKLTHVYRDNDISLEANSSKTMGGYITLPELQANETYEARLMLWDNLDNMSPVVTSTRFTVE